MTLTYQPTFDPAHAAFRMSRLLLVFNRVPVPVEAARILDFYLIFPFRLGAIRLKRNHLAIRALAKRYEAAKPYGAQPDDKVLFDRMAPFQHAALSNLSAKKIISPEELVRATIKQMDELPAHLAEVAEARNRAEPDLMEALMKLYLEYPLSGTDGLKDRTQLLEYRYDAA